MFKRYTFLFLFFIGLSSIGWGQVNITAGDTYTQDFTIGGTTTAPLPTGWKVDKNATVRLLGTYAAAGTATERSDGNNMSNTAGNGIYNFGAGIAASATDRSIGGLSSSSASKSVNSYLALKNNGSESITSFTISYAVEKYRNGSNTAGFSIQMYYSTNGTSWTSAGSDFLTSFGADANNNGFASAPGTTANVSSKTLTLEATAGSTIYLAWNYSVTSGTSSGNAQALGIDDVSITAVGGAPTPTITVSESSLSSFGNVLVGSTSDQQSYNISGSNLSPADGDITITPPTGFKVSTTDGGPYSASPIAVAYTDGALALTPIYVVFSPTSLGEATGNISNSSGGADETTVGVVGIGVGVESITLGTLTGAPFCVDASNSASGTIAFTIAGTFNAGNNFTAYLSDASGSFVGEVNIGTLTNTTGDGTVNITIPARTITGSGYKIRIKSNNPVAISNETATFVITNGVSNVTGVSASNGNAKSILTWTNPTNCFDEILIVAKAGSAVTASLSGDGSSYTGDLTFGSGTAFDGGFIVYKGTTSPETVTGLTNDVTYYFSFFTRRGTTWSTGVSTTATPLNQLEPGDIALIMLQSSSPDKFAFVALVDIPSGAQIKFTDNAFDGSNLKNNEGSVTWTAPEIGVTKGTIVTITPYTSASIGTITGSNLSIAGGGDPIIAYTGTNNYIFALSNIPWRTSGSVTNNDSYLPTGLIDGYSAVDFGSLANNLHISTTENQGSRNSFLSSICQSSNWTTSESAFGSLPSWTFTFGNSTTTSSVSFGSNVVVSTSGNIGISNITFGEVTNSGSITVDRFTNAPSAHGLATNVSGYRFIIEPDNSLVFTEGTGYTLRFNLSDIANHGISELANGNNTSVRLYKRSTPGAGEPTGPITLTYYRNGTDGNQSDDYLVSDVIISGFSEFFFGSELEPLPVELTSFTASAKGTSVILNWETKTEVDNNGFEVERNSTGTWQKIGFVEGHGTANSPKYYSFSDNSALGNKIQYRLKQIDNDGAFEYSPTVEVELNPTEFALYQNYPNPFNPSTIIRYSMPVGGNVSIEVYNALGEKITSLVNSQVEAGYHEVSFDATNLPSGLYFYKINTDGYTSVKKMLLMK